MRTDDECLECGTGATEERDAQIAAMREALEASDPPLPPMLEGETDAQYTDRLTGADGTGRYPYPEHRNRQCSIGYHDECSDPEGEVCKCPCHQFERLRAVALTTDGSAVIRAAAVVAALDRLLEHQPLLLSQSNALEAARREQGALAADHRLHQQWMGNGQRR